MTMIEAVTDTQVAALHAQLAADVDEHKRLISQLDLDGRDRVGYATLLAAAFFEAAYERFYKTGNVADIIAFVASVREMSDDLAETVDPQVAERLIRHALGDPSISIADIGDEIANRTKIVLLAGLVADQRFDASALDAFMAKARTVADDWMRKNASEGRAR